MQCAEIKSHLSEYLDGVLDTKTKRLIEKHMGTCGECKKTLESLRLLVHELNDLEPAKAPDDFLEQLYDRMEKRTTLQSIKNRFFVPFRIKIPLQVAATAAMAVLIFFVIHTPEIEKNLSHMPRPGAIRDMSKESDVGRALETPHEKMPALAPPAETNSLIETKTEELLAGVPQETAPKRLTSKSKKTAVTPSFHEKDSIPDSAARKSEPTPSIKEAVKVVELVLSLDLNVSEVKYGPQLDSEIKGARALQKERTFETKAPAIPKSRTGSMGEVRDENTDHLAGEGPKTKDEPILHVLSRNEALSRVIELVGDVKGTVLSTRYDQDTGLPDLLAAEIPTGQYRFFFEKIQQLGSLQTPTPDIDVSGSERLKIRIHLIQSRHR